MTIQKLYQQRIEEITEAFKKIKPERIILYGSVAYGKVEKDSDIDICVIKKTNNRLEIKHKLRDILWEEKIGFEPEVDIHVYPPNVYYDWLERQDPFIEEIEKGKVLYEKKSLR